MQQQGFSLIELVVTVVVMMAVSMFAIPAFQSSIGNSQIRTVTESIKNGLQQARVEAIKRNTRIRFTLQANGAWELGCVAPADAVACPAIISQKSASEGSSANVAIIADYPSAVFTGFGTRDPGVANGLSRVDVSSIQVARAERRDLRIILAAGGHARVCDPAVNAVGDIRKC
ncbi:GspH/FimT family pseudopilin [Methylophilus flavus]|uniref:Type II secretion system protein H n=1 Tax=Methylophilus flavus TaxID=640084 RepID=A0ABW3P8K4_9PROT